MNENDTFAVFKFGQWKWIKRLSEGHINFACGGAYIKQANQDGNNEQGDKYEGVFARLQSNDPLVEHMRDLLGDDLESIDDGSYVLLRRQSAKKIPMFCFYKYNVADLNEGTKSKINDNLLDVMPVFKDYGLLLNYFTITRFVKPDGDRQYELFKDIHFRKYSDIAEAKIRQQVGIIEQRTEAERTVIEAQARAQKRNIEGYTYQQERGFDVAEKVAQNEGAGNLSSAGVGLGVMAGVGGTIGQMTGKVLKDSLPLNEREVTQVKYCDKCGAQVSLGADFCDQCGNPLREGEKCNNCGYVFERPGKYCPKCGIKRD